MKQNAEASAEISVGRDQHWAAFRAFNAKVAALADDPTQSATTKDAALAALGDDPGPALRAALDAAGLPHSHARHLTDAARKLTRAPAMRSWSDLLNYCRFAAAPEGAFLLALYGEDPALRPAAEALCAARLIARRLANCKADYADHGRVFLPGDWLRQAGCGWEALSAPSTTPPLRTALDRSLDGVDLLLVQSRPLISGLRDSRLRHGAIQSLAQTRALAGKLRRADPLTGPVRLGRRDRLRATIARWWWTLRGPRA